MDALFLAIFALIVIQASKYRPCPLLEKMVAAGRLGRKAGRGFYEYAEKKA